MAPNLSLFTLILKLLPFISLASAFSLYGYGGTLNGASLLYYNDKAYLLNGSSTNSSYSNVYFVEDPTSGGVYLANLNQTSTTPAPPKNLKIFVPTNNATSSQVGFTSVQQSNQTSSGFKMYGSTLMQTDPTTAALTSNFYAQPVQAGGPVDDILELIWLGNATAMKNTAGFPVALRSIPPSKATSSTPTSS